MCEEDDRGDFEVLWLEEIIRETEHYYQGEIQQEQRASWLLASVSVLLALFIGAQSSITTHVFWLVLALFLFFVSGVLAIITIIPLRGTRIRRDLFGGTYRTDKRLGIDSLIETRFRLGKDWSEEKFKKRVFYHYRSHYLRSRMKEYFVVWSSIFFLLGLIFLGVVGLFGLFQ